MRKVFFASDHAGVELKNTLIEIAKASHWVCVDLGPSTTESVDYPDFADLLAAQLKTDSTVDRGVLICGTGIGMSIRANRYQWIRAALCTDLEMATLAREHNDANVLCLGARKTSADKAKEILSVFLSTAFSEGRHTRRVEKLGLPT